MTFTYTQTKIKFLWCCTQNLELSGSPTLFYKALI